MSILNINEINQKYFDYIMNEMKRRSKNNWTENEAEDFVIWLTAYLINHKGPRSLFGQKFYHNNSRKSAAMLAHIFLKEYGGEIK